MPILRVLDAEEALWACSRGVHLGVATRRWKKTDRTFCRLVAYVGAAPAAETLSEGIGCERLWPRGQKGEVV